MNAVGSLRVKSGRRGKGALREQPPHVIWRLLEPRIYDLPYLADEDLGCAPSAILGSPQKRSSRLCSRPRTSPVR